MNLLWVPYQGYDYGELGKVSLGIFGGIFGGLFGGLVGIEERAIKCVELLVRSRVRLRRRVIAFLTGGIVGGLLGALLWMLWAQAFFVADLQFYVISGGVWEGFVLASAALLLSGVSRGAFDDHTHTMPNQGIRDSARNCVIGLPIGLAIIVSSITLPILVFTHNLHYLIYSLFYYVPESMIVILILVLMNGGYTCIQHVVLRIILRFNGDAPWNYPHFLDYTAERILLRKVGGGYIFVHRLLLEYFAALDNQQIPNKKFRTLP